MPRDLPVGNGTVLVNFDRDYCMRDVYFPHVGKENQTIGHMSRFGVWVDGEFEWIGPQWEKELKYLPETLVTDVRLRNERLGLELKVHDAVDFHLWVYLRQIHIKDLFNRDRDVRLYFNHDFHIGGNEVGDTAFYDPRTQSVIHYKDSRWFLIGLCDATKCGVDQWATGTKELECLEGTWKDAEDGELSGNPIAQGSVDSTIGIYVSVPAGSTKTAHYWICFGVEYDKVVKLNSIVRDRGPESLLRRTENYWRLWINKENTYFQDLPEKLVWLYKRSLLIIRTQIDNDGAIIAANDWDITQFARDTYSYMWPRDGALVAYALGRAGYLMVCVKFFEFCLNAIREYGFLMHKYNPDGSLASSWHPWLRNGKFDLPIQEDETALVLWSLWQHFAVFRDVEAIKPLYRKLITNTADFLVRYTDEKTKLPLPSHDLWEERYGVHLFTVASVIGGLTAAVNFARAFGESEQADHYAAVLEAVRNAMVKYMWNGKEGRFCRMASRTADGYELDMTVDSSMSGIFAFGALPVTDERVQATMEAIRQALWVKTDIGGLCRYYNDRYHQVSQDLKSVPGNPWFVSTMWLAQYEIACARTISDLDTALELLHWVAAHALPSGVLAEQVHPYTGEPLSVSPLTWSHAAYVICVCDYLDKRRQLLESAGDAAKTLSIAPI